MLLTFKCLHQRAMMRLDLNYVLPLRELGVSDWSAFAQGLRLYLQPFYAELLENGMSCLTVWSHAKQYPVSKTLSGTNEA